MMAGAAVLSSFTYVPILAREVLGAEEILITLLVGGYATAAFISSYIFGRAGDIYGRKIVIRLGLIAALVSFGLLLIARDFQTLFIIRLMNGFCVGVYPGALAAYAYESDMKMGRFASWGALGWGSGTLLAGYAAGTTIYPAFLMSTIFFVIALLSAMTLPTIERAPIKVSWFPVETFKRNMPVYLAVFIRHSSAFAIWTLWPLFLFDLGADSFFIGVIQATNAVAQVVFMVTFTDKLDCRRLVLLGLLSSAITFISFTLAVDVFQIVLSQILLGFSWATLYVGALKYVTERNVERSTASGLLQSVLSISGVVGPIMAAIIYTIWPGYEPIMFYAALMSLLALAIFAINGREKQESAYSETQIVPAGELT
ncbi:MFS transporter [Candidatus Thorarchaeota archaeon]|nr:MAG: MFS transporter [Candidatus Thorarchaeota archaeon]